MAKTHKVMSIAELKAKAEKPYKEDTKESLEDIVKKL